jgi:peptide/nickel transport system permease protein
MTIRWLLSRILLFLPSLIGVSLITFVIANSVPGDPVYALVGERADPVLMESYRKKLGLDRGLFVRYLRYLKMVSKGDLGQSFYTGRLVGKELGEKFPNTLLLAVVSMTFATLTGLFLGILCTLYRNRWQDRLILFLTTGIISMPVFWFGMLLIYFFSVRIHLFPTGGMEGFSALVLPALTLGARSMGYLARLTRSCLLDILNSEYILAVKARGGGPYFVMMHAMKNVLIPLVTFIGLDFGSYLNGSVLTETIFGWDGIGRYAISGIFRRDYPVIIGSVMFGSVIFMLVNLFIDVLYFFLNPKIRKGSE